MFKDEKYSISNLFVVYKNILGVNEAFICEKCFETNMYREIFTKTIIESSDDDVVKCLCDYYPLILRVGSEFSVSLADLLNKYNDINHVNYLLNYVEESYSFNTNIFSDAEEYNKFNVFNFFNKYDIKKIHLVKTDGNKLSICKFSPIFETFINIFTKDRFNQNLKIGDQTLADYFSDNNIICNYSKLSSYSLLRVYNELNRLNYVESCSNLEQAIKKELINRGIYNKSKIYLK